MKYVMCKEKFNFIAATVAAGLMAGCGPTTLQQLTAQKPSPYVGQCQTLASAHEKAVSEQDYLPPDFRPLQWSATGKPSDDGLLSEDKVMAAIAAGEVRHALIQARGGIGKSELVKAIEAEMCAKRPTFALDFKEIATAGGTEAAIVRLLGRQLAVDTADTTQLQTLLGAAHWLLVVDSLDEVPPTARAQGLQALAEMRKHFAQMQLILMGRPAVYDQYYGLQDLDTVLEMRPLDCSRARSAMLRKAVDKPDRDRMHAFVTTWRLDAQADKQQCVYPFMATYRDLESIQRAAATFEVAKDRGGQRHNLAQVHEGILTERVRKELAELQLKPEDMFAAVDKMLQRDGWAHGEWNLTFSVDRCLAAEGGDTARNRHLCEELLQSVMFERIGGNRGSVKGAEWQFSNQALADLFVSRWMDTEIAKAGSCKPLDDQAKMFPGKEVAGYLVGRPNGGKCLGPVLTAACGEGSKPEELLFQIRRGLPADQAARDAAVAAAKAGQAGRVNACVDGVLGKL